MTLVPNPTLYEAVARERRARYQARAAAPRRRAAGPVRVRIGRMLIAVGTTISGDCIELRRRRSPRRATA
jgi:hypothetical protein